MLKYFLVIILISMQAEYCLTEVLTYLITCIIFHLIQQFSLISTCQIIERLWLIFQILKRFILKLSMLSLRNRIL